MSFSQTINLSSKYSAKVTMRAAAKSDTAAVMACD
jgi:hypothetical protein